MNSEYTDEKSRSCQICFKEISSEIVLDNNMKSNYESSINNAESDKNYKCYDKASLECSCIICLECFFLWICFFNDISNNCRVNNKNQSSKKNTCESNNKQMNKNDKNYIKFICPNYTKCCSNELTLSKVNDILLSDSKNYDLRIRVIQEISKKFFIVNEKMYNCQNNKCNLPSYLPKPVEDYKKCSELFECPYCFHKWDDEKYIINRTVAVKKQIHNFYSFLLNSTNLFEILRFYTVKTLNSENIILMIYTKSNTFQPCVYCDAKHTLTDIGEMICIFGIISRMSILLVIALNIISSYAIYSYNLNSSVFSGILTFIYYIITTIITAFLLWATPTFLILTSIIYGFLKDNGFKNTFSNYIKIRTFKTRHYYNQFLGLDYTNSKNYYLVKVFAFFILLFLVKNIYLMNNEMYDNYYITFSIHSKFILDSMKISYTYIPFIFIFIELKKLYSEKMLLVLEIDNSELQNHHMSEDSNKQYIKIVKVYISAFIYKIASILVNSLCSFQTYLESLEFE